MTAPALSTDDPRRSEMLHSLRLPRSEGEPARRAPAVAANEPARPAPRRAVALPVALAAVVLVQGAGLVALWHRPATAVATVAPAAAAPVAGVAAPPVSKLEASGFVTATRTATVSARAMGQVAEVLVDEGSHVRAGQVVARLDDAEARTDLRVAQAQLDSARARAESARALLADTKRDLAREQALRDEKFSSEARVSKAQTASETARAALDAAEADAALAAAQVQRQQQMIGDLVVRAPFDGIVQERNAQVGEIVAPGGAGGGYTRTGICTIVDMNSLEIVVDVNEEMISRVQPGQKVQAELYAHKGWRIEGEVLRVMPNADRAKATVRARIRLLTSDPRILPDMAAKVFFL